MAATTYGLSATRGRGQWFWFWAALYCAVFSFGLFAATYWLQLAAGTFKGGGPLLHLHAVLFSGWTVLLVSQTWLAARGHLEHHRAWGLLGIALASAMVSVGMAVAIRNVAHYVDQGLGQAAYAFMMFPLSGIAEFALFFALAIANIARPDWHKRFMMVATAGLLQAPAGRIGFLAATHGGGPGLRPGLGPPAPIDAMLVGAAIASLVLVAGAIWDWRTRRAPHAAWLIGIVVIVGVGALSPMITATSAWTGLVSWLLDFGR